MLLYNGLLLGVDNVSPIGFEYEKHPVAVLKLSYPNTDQFQSRQWLQMFEIPELF